MNSLNWSTADLWDLGRAVLLGIGIAYFPLRHLYYVLFGKDSDS